MKKLISLGILSLSLIACGEQFQAYYVGNAQITGPNSCDNRNNGSLPVSIRVRAQYTGNNADFTIVSATAIETDSNLSTGARDIFYNAFINQARPIPAKILNEDYFNEEPNVGIDTRTLLSAGLTEERIEDVARETKIILSGFFSTSRDQINNFNLRRTLYDINSDTFCEIGFTAPLLVRQ